jgi:protein-tyrosine phosphatase
MPPRMKAQPLNLDWLTESLAIGGSFPPDAAERLARDHEVTRVVDLRDEDCDELVSLRRHGIRHLHLPTPDARAISPADIARGVAWVARARAARRKVLVHCQHGIGRSALLAMCVLVDAGVPPLETMLLAKNAREVVSPSPEQLGAFILFAGQRRRATATWVVPSFDALAAIAYRHLQPAVQGGGGR